MLKEGSFAMLHLYETRLSIQNQSLKSIVLIAVAKRCQNLIRIPEREMIQMFNWMVYCWKVAPLRALKDPAGA